MATRSSIEWTEVTWNPVTGCNKVSAGCKFCYAERMAKRLKSMGLQQYREGFKLTLAPQTLNTPFTWSKPRVVFVNSMSDLFHEKVPLSYIQRVFDVMNKTPQHTYQVLTKRSARLEELAPSLSWSKNIWMGVSVERDDVVFRVDNLRNTPAYVKFLSIEPLIGPVSSLSLKGIDWVIVGGESGPGARPMKKEWIEDVYQKSKKARIPFFFKQWGLSRHNVDPEDPTIKKDHPLHAKGGCMWNGQVHREMPSTRIF